MSHQPILFSEVVQLIPRHEFQKCVNRHDGDNRVRKLDCWTQFLTLLFGQITGHNSLRSMVAAINSQKPKLYQLGMSPLCRSTLSEANEKRDPKILEEMFSLLLNRTQSCAPGHPFRFKGKVLAFDSTTIGLCLSLSPWAKFHHGKGAFKLHTALDLAGNLPVFVVLTPGKVHDIKVARRVQFPVGATVMMDRGYIDFSWLYELDKSGVFFVTRMKDNCRYKVRKCRSKNQEQGIAADQDVRLTGSSSDKYPDRLRKISYRDPVTKDHYVFLTNRVDLSAKTICNLYKSRWQVELFFKVLKGQLHVEKFVGTSVNAVLWQVWAAMIAYLLVSLIRFQHKLQWPIPSIMAVLTVSLFQRIGIKQLFGQAPRERCRNIGFRQLLLFDS